jgi:nitrite reductase (NO-forming)
MRAVGHVILATLAVAAFAALHGQTTASAADPDSAPAAHAMHVHGAAPPDSVIPDGHGMAGGAATRTAQARTPAQQQRPAQTPAPAAGTMAPMVGGDHSMPDAAFTLVTGIADGKLVYIGRGGKIEGQVNPTLDVNENDLVQITIINGEGARHDIFIPDFRSTSQYVTGKRASSTVVFRVGSRGSYSYFCDVPGHRDSGMEGRIEVHPKAAAAPGAGVSIVRDPAELPPPIPLRGPALVRFDLETVELEGKLDDQSTYTYWTFNGKVPGPFLRARVGDTVEMHLKNAKDSLMIHSVDLHAVIGPGGGAGMTQAEPGQELVFTFKAMQPGLYVYHCATPMVANHIAAGMYGMILIEPEAGLPKVDHEFYVMQGELYTGSDGPSKGLQEFSVEKLLNERPEYFVFNGAPGGLTAEHPLHAKVGETVRIFFGVGGPNFTSSFHVIGEIFDRAYSFASLTSPALTGVQTISVPPGGAAMVEMQLHVPGRYILVDHALTRMERGLAGYMIVDGPAAPEIIHSGKAQ